MRTAIYEVTIQDFQTSDKCLNTFIECFNNIFRSNFSHYPFANTWMNDDYNKLHSCQLFASNN